MKVTVFALILSTFSSVGMLAADVEKPYYVVPIGPSYTDGIAKFALAAPAGTCLIVSAQLTSASGSQWIPVGVPEWRGGDRSWLNLCGSQEPWSLTLTGKPAGLYKLSIGSPINEKFLIIFGGYVPPENTGVPEFADLPGLVVGPAELITPLPIDYSHGVLFLGATDANGRSSARHDAGFTYLVYQIQEDGLLHFWAINAEMGVYPQPNCTADVTLTLPLTPPGGGGFEADRASYVMTIDGATGESLAQPLTFPVPGGLFSPVCQS